MLVLIVGLFFKGDGSALIFKDNENVFTFSMHCHQNFPFRKQHSDLDINLNKGDGDLEFLRLLEVRLTLNS